MTESEPTDTPLAKPPAKPAAPKVDHRPPPSKAERNQAKRGDKFKHKPMRVK